MSYRPHAFGILPPPVCVWPIPLRWYQAMACKAASLFPEYHTDVVPARQAYSHSASVGSRYSARAACSGGSSPSLRQNADASSQLTVSTGRVGSPWFLLGLLPTTRSYSACVTSYVPR